MGNVIRLASQDTLKAAWRAYERHVERGFIYPELRHTPAFKAEMLRLHDKFNRLARMTAEAKV